MPFDVAELLTLYEVANFSFPERYEDLMQEITEKGSRLLGIRRLAIMLDEDGKLVCLGRWGFRKDEEVTERIQNPGENALVHLMSRGVQGLVFLETAGRIEDPKRKLFHIFARRIEDIIALKHMEKKIKESEQAFRTVFDSVHDAIFVHRPDGKILDVNQTTLRLYGIASKEEAVKLSILEDCSSPDNDLEQLSEWWKRAVEGESPRFEWKARRPADGTVFDAEVCLKKIAFGGQEAILATVRDITERKREEELLRSIFDHSPIGMYIASEGKFQLVNFQFEKLSGYSREELIGREALSLVFPEDRETVRREAVRMLKGGEARPYEFRIITKHGETRWVEETVASWQHEGRRVTLGSIVDVTERKRFAQKLEYVSLHDQLTGLYNRAYFEEQLKRLGRSNQYPVSIVVADVNGLKLVNDTLGHHKGDKLLISCARILKEGLRQSDIVARVGGDEFVALLPRTDEAAGSSILRRLRSSIEQYNRKHPQLPLSVSFGIATAYNSEELVKQAYKKADDLMYREKLHLGTSARSQIVNALLAALSERDHLTEGHGRRLQHLCRILGERVGLSPQQMANLSLLAQVHDIGKVGIPDTILFKTGSLTEEEWEIMRQHSEKGYRIALASPDLAAVADLILKHHERWDGSGYPLGLKGEEIPVECRILAIADAFDAMTSHRPYRKAGTVEEALQEIRRCAGTQFDPELVEVFLQVILSEDQSVRKSLLGYP